MKIILECNNKSKIVQILKLTNKLYTMNDSFLNSKFFIIGYTIIVIASIITIFSAGIDFGKWLADNF